MIIHSPIISGSLTFADGSTFTLPDNGVYSGSFSGSVAGIGDPSSFSASLQTKIQQLNIDTGSQDARLDLIESYTSSLDTKNSTLATYTGSLNSKNSTLATYTASVDSKNSTLATYTASLDSKNSTLASYTASVDSKNSTLATYTASLDTKHATLANVTSSLSTYITNHETKNVELGIYTASLDSKNSTLATYTASVDTSFSNQATKNSTLATYTASLDTKNSTLATYTASLDTKNSNLATYTSSVDTKNSTLATYTASVDSKNSTLATYTASLETKNSNLATTTGSLLASQTNLNSYTGSLLGAFQVTGSKINFLGDVTIYGTQSIISSTNVEIADNILYLAPTASLDNDLGIVGHYNDGTYRHAGIFMDASDGHSWKVFNGLQDETSAQINVSGTGFTLADFKAGAFTGTSFTGPLTGNASTATTLQTARTINGTSFNGSADITIANLVSGSAQIDGSALGSNKTITVGSTSITLGGTATTIAGLSSVTSTAFVGALTGNASTATTLQTARNINGVSFNGSADITLTATATNALTIGTGLSGTSYNGSSAVTIANTGVLSNVAGTGVSVSGATGNVTISIGQSVATSASPTFAGLSINGAITATGDITAFSASDIRFKENITAIESPIEKIKMISGNTYDWKAENKDIHGFEGNDVGVIAQEIEEVLPQLVVTRDNGYKAVKYDKLVALLIEGIKEQQKQIEDLSNKINKLENEL